MSLTRVGKWTLLSGFVGLELVVGGVCYVVWSKCNASQDYRKWMYHKHPAVLSFYYTTCEMGEQYFTKQNDLKDWGVIKPKKKVPFPKSK